MGMNTVKSYLAFADDPPVREAIGQILHSGWAVEADDGSITYEVGGERRYAANDATVLDDLHPGVYVRLPLFDGPFEVRLFANSERHVSREISLWADAWQFDWTLEGTTKDDAAKDVERYLEMVESVANVTTPNYGYGDNDIALAGGHPSSEQLTDATVSKLFWLLLIPLPPAGGRLSWKTLRETPCWRVRRVGSKLAVFVSGANPVRRRGTDRERERTVFDHWDVPTKT